jgi:hypothetical protein
MFDSWCSLTGLVNVRHIQYAHCHSRQTSVNTVNTGSLYPRSRRPRSRRPLSRRPRSLRPRSLRHRRGWPGPARTCRICSRWAGSRECTTSYPQGVGQHHDCLTSTKPVSEHLMSSTAEPLTSTSPLSPLLLPC